MHETINVNLVRSIPACLHAISTKMTAFSPLGNQFISGLLILNTLVWPHRIPDAHENGLSGPMP